ncbi:hypothetical protein MKD33_01045, partial [Chromobacterium piscinae]
IAGLPA